MDVIIDKVKNISQLHENVKKYSEEIPKFNKTSFGTDIIINIKKIDAIFNQLYTFTKKTLDSLDISEIFKIWGLIYEIHYIIKDNLSNLETVAIRHQKRFVEELTDNDIEKINDLYGNIIVFYNKYKKNANQTDIHIITELYNIVHQKLKWTKQTAMENAKILTEIVKKHPHSVSLYSYIMQQNINTCLSFGPDVCDGILNYVEIAKDFIMLYEKKLQNGKKSLFQSNPNLKTFGLTPTGPAIPLKDITQKIFKTTISSVSKLESLAIKEKVCIVIMNHVIKHPIEFSLWKLIDKDLAQPYIQSSEAGLTQKMIERFETISFKELGNGKKWNFETNYYGSIDSDEFVILVNMNYELFRIYGIYDEVPIFNGNTFGLEIISKKLILDDTLSQLDSSKIADVEATTDPKSASEPDIGGGGRNIIKIHKNKIMDFINYIKNDGNIKNHTRISEYNYIQERKILDNMFLPIKFNVGGIKLNSQIIDSKFLRHEIFLRLIDEFNDIVSTEFKNGDKIKTFKDLGQVIHSARLIDTFNSILVEQYDIYAIKNKEQSSQFPFSETLQTFLSVLFDMNTDFRRLIHDYFIKIKVDPKLFTESSVAKKLQLQTIFKEIITQLLEKIINDERNIYQELIYKNSMLKLSLY